LRCREKEKEMALQHHFVVVVENGRLYADLSSTDARFIDGSIWDTTKRDWIDQNENLELDDEAFEILATAIEMHNNPKL
jgi:hypothetical protein